VTDIGPYAGARSTKHLRVCVLASIIIKSCADFIQIESKKDSDMLRRLKDPCENASTLNDKIHLLAITPPQIPDFLKLLLECSKKLIELPNTPQIPADYSKAHACL
jgi:hypothetical protein